LKAFENKISIFELTRLNDLAGVVYAEAARDFMRENDLKHGDVEVTGHDGQTIYQEPPVHHLSRNYDDRDDLVSRWLDGPCPLRRRHGGAERFGILGKLVQPPRLARP